MPYPFLQVLIHEFESWASVQAERTLQVGRVLHFVLALAGKAGLVGTLSCQLLGSGLHWRAGLADGTLNPRWTCLRGAAWPAMARHAFRAVRRA